MSIVRIKSKDLNKLNESLQRISLFEADLKKSDIQKDAEDDTFYTDINTDNEELVANNINDTDDISIIDDNDSPSTKKQKLIADFTNALSSEMEINQRLQDILTQYTQIQDDSSEQGDGEWKIDNKKHDIYLKDLDAHVFRQNHNICLSYNHQIRTFSSNKELNDYLSNHDIPQVDETMMNSLVESAEGEETVLTEAPLWSKWSNIKDKLRDKRQQWQQARKDVTPEEVTQAVLDDKVHFIKDCIKHGVNTNFKMDETGVTPLMYAAREGMVDMVDALSEDKNALNSQDKDGFTPLMYGILAGGDASKNIISNLLKKGADATMTTKAGETAAQLASHAGATELKNLFNQQNITASDLATIIKQGNSDEIAQSLNSTNIAKVLNTPINKEQETPFMTAAAMARASDVKKLLDAGGDLSITDKNFRTPLMYAASSKVSDPQTYQMLVDAGADENIKDVSGKSALDYQNAKTNPEAQQDTTNAEPNDAQQAQAQAEPEAEPEMNANTAQATAGAGNAQAKQKTANAQATANTADAGADDATAEPESPTAGLERINAGRANIIKNLIDNGKADVNVVDPATQKTSLDMATDATDGDMVNYLGQHNAKTGDAIRGQNTANAEQPQAAQPQAGRRGKKAQAQAQQNTAAESFDDYVKNLLKTPMSLRDSADEDEEEPMEECMGGVGAGVTTASLAPAVTRTMYKRPTKKKK